MINNEHQAEKYFKFLGKLKNQKHIDKMDEMRRKMNMKEYKDFITLNIEE